MKITSLFFIAVIFFSSCDFNGITGSGNIITEKRSVDRFDAIKVVGSIDVEVRNGDVPLVEVEADDNILPDIITEVKNGVFMVRYKPNMSFHNTQVKAYVTVPSLKKITIAGSGSVISNDVIKNDEEIEFSVDGSGDIKMAADAPSVKARINGSGNIVLQGRTKNFTGIVGGSGDLKCHELRAENADVEIRGSGSAHVFSSVSLNAKTRGSGDIYYSGNPASTEIDKKGSGGVSVGK